MSKSQKDLLHNILQVLIVLSAIGLYIWWARVITFDENTLTHAPDERMRFMIPNFIYTFGRLPTGYDPEVIHKMGNWSYAFFPQFLGPIISAVFMRMMSIVHDSQNALVFAARLTSVLSGTVAIFFVNRTIFVLTKNKIYSILGMTLLAFWPQFAFLSSYVNNDIIALAGISIMCYSIARSINEGWSVKISITLAVGMTICLLSYMNSYGFVLAFGIYYILTNIMGVKKQIVTVKEFCTSFVIIFSIVSILCFPFFIRNAMLYNGDFFGLTTFRQESINWGQNEGLIWATEQAKAWSVEHSVPWDENTIALWLSHNTNLGYSNHTIMMSNPYQGSLFSLIRNIGFINTTYQSFISAFGSMTIFLPSIFYSIYGLVIGIALIGLLRFKFHNINTSLFVLSCFLGVLITFALHLIYVLTGDFQAQGRYIISILVPLVICSTYGFKSILSPLSTRKANIIMYSLVFIYIGLMAYIFRGFVLS